MKVPDQNTDKRRTPWRLLTVLAVPLILFVVARLILLMIAGQSFEAPPREIGNNAPFITSPDSVIENMVMLADLTEEDLVYDLGCGDGRIVIAAVQRTGCRGVGYDIDPELIAKAQENARQHGVEDRVEFVEQDIFTVDLSEADAAVMFLLPWMMNKLVPQFDQMRPGCRIVSHEFWIEGVEPDQVIECLGDLGDQPQAIYLYTTPLKRNPNMERGTPPVPGNLAPVKQDDE